VIEEAFLEGVAPTRPCSLHATDVRPIEDERDPRPRSFPGERRPWWRIF
jgi:hypothetical protein